VWFPKNASRCPKKARRQNILLLLTFTQETKRALECQPSSKESNHDEIALYAIESWDWVAASVAYGTAVGWVHVGFCSARCKAIYEDIETTLPKIAGTPSLLTAIRAVE
jgi:hypothetical protein